MSQARSIPRISAVNDPHIEDKTPKRPDAGIENAGPSARSMAVGAGIAIGSAAIVAALLYSRSNAKAG